MRKIFGKNTLKDVDENEEDHSTMTIPLRSGTSNKAKDNKICIGDRVKIRTKEHVDLRGTVVYVGYPYPGPRAPRYGINLEKAKGEHNGSLFFDIKTDKIITKARHLSKYKKRIKKRTFFKAKSKHGIFVRKNEITSIERHATSSTRCTIEDTVEVRFRGIGTIKFIGNLEHTKEMGIWYGIQLADRRGRHDGTVNGVKYFQCAAQYGLHTRQNHLTLIDTSIVNNNKGGKGSDTNLTVKEDIATRRGSFSDKKQKGNKWAKILGANQVKGFAIRNASMANLSDPKHMNNNHIIAHHHHMNPSNTLETTTIATNTSVLSLKLGLGTTSTTSKRKLTYGQSLSNILPPNMNFTNNISVHVLPGMHKKITMKKISEMDVESPHHNQQESTSVHGSVKRGGTIAVLPGYSQFFKHKKFFDHFDFDEIEDELGEGEFGVVYKCRRVDIEDDDDEYSTTLKTSISNKYGNYASVTNTLSIYPGDTIDEENDSDSDGSLSGSYSESSSEDEEEYFAVKKIKKAKFHHLNWTHKQESIKLLQQEIKLLEKIQHLKKRNMDGSKYIVDLVDVFEDRNYLYIVTNFCGGGNLWKLIESDTHSERHIQEVMKQLLEGLAFLHRHNLAHLDLKPDNIMFNINGEIQLIDFGMSRMIPPLHKAGVLVGTPNFVAPEVIQGFYDRKADIWSVGIIFFMLRFGYPPFFEGNSKIHHDSMDITGDDLDEEKQKSEHDKLFDKIKKGFNAVVKPGLGAWFPESISVSDELKDLIAKMLCSDLAKRLTAAECLSHPYFKKLADPNKLSENIMDALTKFSGQCHFNVMIARLFAHQIEPEQIRQLRECWNKFDIDSDGSLTLSQFKKAMCEYDHGYKEYQIETIFENLDWNETDTINFQALLTAYSYQRLVAVDERLWEAFARLDVDNDGHITKAEIKRVLAIVNPQEFDDGLNKLNEFKPINMANDNNVEKEISNMKKLTAKERREKNISVWIGECMVSADWDDDGQIDYEEFLRALHPRFNEHPVTPKFNKTPTEKITEVKFIFQPSLNTAGITSNYNGGGSGGSGGGNGQITPIDAHMNNTETNKGAFETYMNKHKNNTQSSDDDND